MKNFVFSIAALLFFSNFTNAQSNLKESRSSNRTFSMIKPHAMKDAKKIQDDLKAAGFNITKQKRVLLDQEKFYKLYGIHKDKAFFNDLKREFLGKEVIVQVLECNCDAVNYYRQVIGSSDNPNSLRGKYAQKDNKTNNAVHGSDSIENANNEIKIFFHE
jgi:nucleoside-diphosphate kinase